MGFNPSEQGIKFSIEDRAVKAGELVVVEILASQFTQVYGFQMSAKLKGLTLINAEGRGISLDNSHVATSKSGLMTMSWPSAKAETVANGSKVMILTFKAIESGQLSKMIQILETYDRTSNYNSIMKSESYIGESMEIRNIVFEIRSDVRSNVFNVSQNEPNPWKSETTIAYELPKASPVNISVYDITGKTIWTYVSTTAKAGTNILTLTHDQLKGATGVMIYKIESGDFTAQKKMIVVE